MQLGYQLKKNMIYRSVEGMNILKTYNYKGRLIWKYATDHYQVEGYGKCKTLKESKQKIAECIM